jgi:hypothetical protein
MYGHRIRLSLLSGLGLFYVTYAYSLGSGYYEYLSWCPFLILTGYRCPLCGITHAVGALLHQDTISAKLYHPFGPVILVAITALWLRTGIALSRHNNRVQASA